MISRGKRILGRWETDCPGMAPEGIRRNAGDRDLSSPQNQPERIRIGQEGVEREDTNAESKPSNFLAGDLSPENGLAVFLGKIFERDRFPVQERGFGIYAPVIDINGEVLGRKPSHLEDDLHFHVLPELNRASDIGPLFQNPQLGPGFV